MLDSCMTFSLTLKMEVTCTSKTLLIFDGMCGVMCLMIEPFLLTITDWACEAYLYFGLLAYDVV
jgi:hypothetical protein